MRVTSSSETDIYSSVTAAIGSLKGPLHGGANVRVLEMMEDMKIHVKNWKDEEKVKAHLLKILNKKANDYSGKIYGIGHAVYTISDPRAAILKAKARELAIEKNRLDEFELYSLVEKLTPEVLECLKEKNLPRWFVLMLIFTLVLFIHVLIFQKNFIPLCLPLEGFRAGVPTVLKNLHFPQKGSSDLHLKMFSENRSIFRLKTVIRLSNIKLFYHV